MKIHEYALLFLTFIHKISLVQLSQQAEQAEAEVHRNESENEAELSLQRQVSLQHNHVIIIIYYSFVVNKQEHREMVAAYKRLENVVAHYLQNLRKSLDGEDMPLNAI